VRFRLSNPKQRLMTPDELALLKTISARGTLEVAAADPGRPDPAFERTMAALHSLQQVGWISLRLLVAAGAGTGADGGEEMIGAVARCTAEGRRLLVILGE
jgi:hypothetical protein